MVVIGGSQPSDRSSILLWAICRSRSIGGAAVLKTASPKGYVGSNPTYGVYKAWWQNWQMHRTANAVPLGECEVGTHPRRYVSVPEWSIGSGCNPVFHRFESCQALFKVLWAQISFSSFMGLW